MSVGAAFGCGRFVSTEDLEALLATDFNVRLPTSTDTMYLFLFQVREDLPCSTGSVATKVSPAIHQARATIPGRN